MRNHRLADGIILILLGAFLLALNQGWIPTEVGSAVVRNFWPLLLILLGVLVIFRGGVSFGVILIVMLALAAVGVLGPMSRWFSVDWPRTSWQGPAGPRQTETFSEPMATGITQSAISVKMGAGRLTINGGAQSLAEGRLDYATSRPVWNAKRTGERTEIEINQGREERIPISGGGLEWRIKINDSPGLELSADLGAGRAEIDLRKTRLKRLKVSAGAGDLRIFFPEEASMEAHITGGATNMDITVPKNTGIRVRTTNPIIAAALQKEGLLRQGDYFVSKDFGEARSNLEMEISAGVSSVRIRR